MIHITPTPVFYLLLKKDFLTLSAMSSCWPLVCWSVGQHPLPARKNVVIASAARRVAIQRDNILWMATALRASP